MAHAVTSPVGCFIQSLSVAHLVAVAPDAELLKRFTVHREEAAFAALVQRHGPLVLGICHRVLNDTQIVEDCFQETFIVLARKAGFLKGPEALGSWLYGVATRTALKARARAARRRECERRACVAELVAPADGLDGRELRPMLDQAIARLPEKYRTPFVLHYLEGLTVAEVAHRLGWPQGTTCARLARAKEQLRARLARQDLAWCTGTLAAVLAGGTTVPTALAVSTVQAAISVAAGEVTGALSASAAALITGGIRIMSGIKAKVALAVCMTLSALGVGIGVSQYERLGGGHASSGCETCSVAGPMVGNQQVPTDALVFERYYAGGFRSLRGFEFRGVSPKARNAGNGCEEPEALDHKPKDVRVVLQEQCSGNLMFGQGVNSNAGLAGSIVLNERNFDLMRTPSNFGDLFSGNNFRGAGREFCIEATPGTVERFKPGGDFMFLNSIEYQVPVRANDGIFLVAFVDSGTVEQKVEINDYRVSAGFGVRFEVPMLGPVPIALDFAFPLTKGSAAPEWPLHFYVGGFV
jgi:RNA polymerase sigma factor (sigma-70 family)